MDQFFSFFFCDWHTNKQQPIIYFVEDHGSYDGDNNQYVTSTDIDEHFFREHDTTAATEPLGQVLEYDLRRGRGLFVIVDNTTFDYAHMGVNWRTMSKLDYPTDVRNIWTTFHLSSGHADVLHRPNLKPTYRKTSPGEQFDWVLENLVLKPTKDKPAFLMFFLMSHGRKNGEFLLADSSLTTAPCCPCEKLTFTGHCRARKIHDLIKKIDQSEKFLGIPKIFVIQACRGGRCEAIEDGNTTHKLPARRPTDADKFMPECSDVFVFYACIEDQLCWVQKGSFFINEFCESVSEAHTADIQSGILWRKLCERLEVAGAQRGYGDKLMLGALNSHIHQKLGLEDLMLVNDSIAEGWIENICRRATGKVTDLLFKDTDFDGNTKYIKQQPQYVSTLTRKFSIIKLLRHYITTL